MNTNRKNIGILLIVLGLVLIIIIVYFAFLKVAKAPTRAPVVSTTTSVKQLPSVVSSSSGQSNSSPATSAPELSKPTVHKVSADDLGKIAMAFSGRLGSFSNQSTYNNISNLGILMTDSMRSWSKTYITRLSKEHKNSGIFYSIVTHPLLFTVDSFNRDSGKAQITVTTQRQVQGSQAYNQKIRINFLRVNGKWLVDGAYWLK